MVYQFYVEDPGVNKHRWWAGTFLDNPDSFAMYPPKDADQAASWHLPLDLLKPHHDQGRAHIPLYIDAIADPEPLDRILDMDLGRGIITPKGRTTMPYAGHNLMMMFNLQALKRQEMVCSSCFDEVQKMESKPEPCSCTFRKRYLDRWICFPCVMKEEAEMTAARVKQTEVETIGPMHYHLNSWNCRCGVTIMADDEPQAICNWCQGPIVDDEAVDEDENETIIDIEDEESQENEDENAGPEPGNLSADFMGMVKNKDGSVSVWLNGERIHGESLSRETVLKFAHAHGEDVGCSCCHCHHGLKRHIHHEVEQGEAGDYDNNKPMSEEDDNVADGNDDEMADEDEDEYDDMPSLEQMDVAFDIDEMVADVD